MPCILYLQGSDCFASIWLMPLPRILAADGGCYHCVSRVVDRQFIFADREKHCFVTTMRKLEAFLDVKVLTYSVMSNHFHLLIEVPTSDAKVQLNADSLRERLPLLYHGAALAEALAELDRAQQDAESARGTTSWLNALLARYQARMGNLPAFLKELKWRFSKWYNTHNDRVGTLWEDRFRSVLVEGDEHALMTTAAYIELNAVRAGLVADPKDYRWCGYGEAMAGNKCARNNLLRMHARTRAWSGRGSAAVDWRELAMRYRVHLFGHGERRLGDAQTGRGRKPGFEPDKVIQVIEQQRGHVPLHELMRCRIRYFTDGAVIGSEEFVNELFASQRQRFGKRRKPGARKLRGADWGGLTSLRDLRDRVFGV